MCIRDSTNDKLRKFLGIFMHEVNIEHIEVLDNLFGHIDDLVEAFRQDVYKRQAQEEAEAAALKARAEAEAELAALKKAQQEAEAQRIAAEKAAEQAEINIPRGLEEIEPGVAGPATNTAEVNAQKVDARPIVLSPSLELSLIHISPRQRTARGRRGASS